MDCDLGQDLDEYIFANFLRLLLFECNLINHCLRHSRTSLTPSAPKTAGVFRVLLVACGCAMTVLAVLPILLGLPAGGIWILSWTPSYRSDFFFGPRLWSQWRSDIFGAVAPGNVIGRKVFKTRDRLPGNSYDQRSPISTWRRRANISPRTVFNKAWTLIDKPDRTPADDRLMVALKSGLDLPLDEPAGPVPTAKCRSAIGRRRGSRR